MTIIEAVEYIASEKKKNHVIPTHALLKDVSKLTGLNQDQILLEAKEIGLEVGRTINSNYLKNGTVHTTQTNNSKR